MTWYSRTFDTVGEFVSGVQKPRIRLPSTPHLAQLPAKRPTAGIRQQYQKCGRAGNWHRARPYKRHRRHNGNLHNIMGYYQTLQSQPANAASGSLSPASSDRASVSSDRSAQNDVPHQRITDAAGVHRPVQIPSPGHSLSSSTYSTVR
jgi:hypothetical protein